ncbi:MAG: dual specificity protein phosphatase family protein, partial [Planctomycetes bacterium]|nr:dual specificity protein phosphatase family protein [Planctomycetota bacterium]
KDQDITYVRIPPRSWWAPDGSVPAQKGVNQFLKVMDNPANYPVLIHCFGGIHRTGAYCAIYRMEYDRWSNDRAINELREGGYTNLDEEWDLLTYLENYQPRWRQSEYEEDAPPMVQRNIPLKNVKHRKKKPGTGSQG